MTQVRGSPAPGRLLVAVLVAVFIPGCGADHSVSGSGAGSGGGLSGGPMVTPEVETQGQTAAAPVSALDVGIQASMDALVESGIPGMGFSSGNRGLGSSSSLKYPSNVTLTVNLGTSDASGFLWYPGASGLIQVFAEGAVTSGVDTGSATYSVRGVAETDVVFLDPLSRNSATLPTGSVWTFTFNIEWNSTSPDSWEVIAMSHADILLTLLEDRQGERLSVSVQEMNQGSALYSGGSGTLSRTQSGSDDDTVTWTDSVGPHSVELHRVGQSRITITVNGIPYGPLGFPQVQAVFHFTPSEVP